MRAMAALESSNFAPRFSSHFTLNSNRIHPRKPFSSKFGEKFNRKTLKCSLVEKQKKEDKEVSRVFTKEENALIDALIGIQGRGRSASPQQLQVRHYFNRETCRIMSKSLHCQRDYIYLLNLTFYVKFRLVNPWICNLIAKS